MLRIDKITSLDLPELAPYRTLKRSAEHAKLGIFVEEGDKVLHRLLDSEFTLVSVLLIEERLAEFEARLWSSSFSLRNSLSVMGATIPAMSVIDCGNAAHLSISNHGSKTRLKHGQQHG